MKKIIVTALVALTTALTAYAQLPKRNHFALQIMYDCAYEKSKIGSDAKFKRAEKQKGTSIGFLWELDFKKWRTVDIGMESGLTYSYHKGKSSDTRIDGAFKSEIKTQHIRHDLSIPLRFVYRQLIARDTYFTIYFGPNFQFSAGNKALSTEKRPDSQGNITELKTTYNLLSGSEANKFVRTHVTDELEQNAPVWGNVKPFNLQLGLAASLQFHEIQIRGGYDWGLGNLFQYTNTATNLKSWKLTDRVDQWFIGLVLFFPEKKSQW